MRSAKLFALALGIYFCPPLFDRLMTRWYPDEQRHGARVLRRRLWGSLAVVVAILGAVLLFQHWGRGGFVLNEGDWFRVLAVSVAVTGALARGGWSIQSWKGTSVIERVDRAVFVVTQLGVAVLLVFIVTL